MNARQPLPDGSAFNDHGRPEPFEDFDYDALDGERETASSSEEIARARQEATIRLLQFLTAGGSPPEKVGRRTIQLLHVLRPGGTQRALAARLDLTPGRISQELNVLREQIANVIRQSDNTNHSQN